MPIPGLSELADSALKPLTEAASPMVKSFGEAAERLVYRGMFNERRAFENIPAAKTIYDAFDHDYRPLKSKYTDELLKAHKTGAPVDPAYQLKAPANAHTPEHLENIAHQRASKEVFGKDRSAIQAALHSTMQTHGYNRTQILSDNLNIMFKEQIQTRAMQTEKNGIYTGAVGKSKFDQDMLRPGDNQVIQNTESGFKTLKPSPYKATSDTARGIAKVRSLLAYKAAVLHAPIVSLNTWMEYGLPTAVKSFNEAFGPGAEARMSSLQAAGVLSEFEISDLREQEAFNKGIIKQFAPNSVGEFLQRNILQPGMPFMRRRALGQGAFAGSMVLKEAAETLKTILNVDFSSPNPKDYSYLGSKVTHALYAIKRLGLDHVDLASRQFELGQNDINKAYWYGAKNLAFVEPRSETATFWRQSNITRAMNSFHGFTAQQAAFLRNDFIRKFEQGDAAGIARSIGMLGIVYPMVGSSVYELTRLLMGKDWDNPLQHEENRLEGTPAIYYGEKALGIKNDQTQIQMLFNTIDAITHLAAVGQMATVVRDTNRNELEKAFVPPELNMAIQGTEDAFKARKQDANHPDAWKPFARDLIEDTPTPFGINQVMAHILLPTKAERDKNKYKRYTRPRARKPSSNPFNEPDFKY